MSRWITVTLFAAALLVTFVVAGPSPAGAPAATAGPIEGPDEWGNWDCSPEEGVESVSEADFFRLMYFIAGFEGFFTGCRNIGDAVEYAEYGTLFWGDINCDGVVNATDALLLMLWFADLIPDDFPDCPEIGDVLLLIALTADMKAQSIGYQITGPLAGSPGQGDVIPQFFPTPYYVDLALIIHNNGPDSPEDSSDIYWEIPDQPSQMYIRLVATTGDVCYNQLDEVIPCGEGNTFNGVDDRCYDTVDNDADQLVDLSDPDCTQVRYMWTPYNLQQGMSNTVNRRFTARCLISGADVNFNIFGKLRVRDPYEDPELANNETSVNVPDPNCVKFVPAGHVPGPQTLPSGQRPVPYEPAVLPNSGGPPAGRD